jgi:ABC-type nitrate/sulfonate/bicarbonate transport system substrate-binding protein
MSDQNGRRRTLKILGASALAGTGSLLNIASAQPKPEVIKVVLGQARGAGQSAQFPLAIENKIFAAEGLDVSLTLFNSAAEMNEALAGGAVNITATGDCAGDRPNGAQGAGEVPRAACRFFARSGHGGEKKRSRIPSSSRA